MDKTKRKRCKHFTGVMNDKCAAGVNYSGLTKDNGHLPCFEKHESNIICSSLEWPTEAELRERDNDIDLTMEAIKTIRKNNQHCNQSGHIICPKCGKKLNYRISPINGHIWGACSTDGCLSWMM
jgi:hypothetical protein